MSDRASSPIPQPTQHRIELLDNTVPNDDGLAVPEARTGDSLHAQGPTKSHLSQRVNPTALRQEISRRKYTRYQEGRYEDSSRPPLSLRRNTSRSTQAVPDNPDNSAQESCSEDANLVSSQDGRLRRGQKRMRNLLHRKKQRGRLEGDTKVDVLYENQRGGFFFGHPLFSSNSLLNFDPSAWLNAEFKPSSVNITNAQVPDPSWEWAWSTWYVDMSNDVDQQGWQYSFMFQNKFAWHGTHPWFHSFVRRRRWIRKRVRVHRPGFDGRLGNAANFKDAHKLNSDYFTIHPLSMRANSITPGASSYANSSAGLQRRTTAETGDSEVESLGKLRDCLKDAMVDREKIGLVLQFMDQGGEDTYYLADEIPRIMSTLSFQYSKRQLLSCMIQKIDQATAHRQDHVRRAQPESANESRRIDSLVHAIRAADSEIQQLEFWSDIRDAIYRGQSSEAMSDQSDWSQGWDGAEHYGLGRLATGRSSIDTNPVSGAKQE